MDIQKTADWLVRELSAEGFTIQRYDAYGTNSVYLKLDYGVCNSIRISDHNGKKKLKYMYNVLTCHKGEPERVSDGFMRYYYKSTQEHLHMMIKKIKDSRDTKLERFGQQGYLEKMREAKAIGAYSKGFWSQAERVHVGIIPPPPASEHITMNQGVIEW